jgi:adenylate cyclase
LFYKGLHDGGIAEFERAFVLNPNYVDHRYAACLNLAGEPAKALEALEAGIRLDPFSWITTAFCQMGLANYLLKRYGEAVRLCGEGASRRPNMQTPHLFLAAAYAQLGQLEEAKAEAAQVLRINPGFTIERHKRVWVHRDPKDLEHRLDGLRKAGLPEGSDIALVVSIAKLHK